MPTPSHSRDDDRPSWPDRTSTLPATSRSADWRCTRCDKLLGVCRDGQMHLRFQRSHEYFVGFPVMASCRGCGTLNQATAPTRLGA